MGENRCCVLCSHDRLRVLFLNTLKIGELNKIEFIDHTSSVRSQPQKLSVGLVQITCMAELLRMVTISTTASYPKPFYTRQGYVLVFSLTTSTRDQLHVVWRFLSTIRLEFIHIRSVV